MDLTTLKEILISYVPSISVLLGFLASCVAVLKQLKKTDVTKIAETIKDENSELSKQIIVCMEMMKQICNENEYLRKQNNALIGELKRLADYEYKEE